MRIVFTRPHLQRGRGLDLPAQLRALADFASVLRNAKPFRPLGRPRQTVSAQPTRVLLGPQAINCKPEQFAPARVWVKVSAALPKRAALARPFLPCHVSRADSSLVPG
jgi:hypothetical protein